MSAELRLPLTCRRLTDLYQALYALSERCLASAKVEDVVVSCARRDGIMVMLGELSLTLRVDWYGLNLIAVSDLSRAFRRCRYRFECVTSPASL